MLYLSKILYSGKSRIKIEFSYDYHIKEDIKSLSTAGYSKTLKAWHIEYSKEAFKELKALGYNIEIGSKKCKFVKKEECSENKKIGDCSFTIQIHNSKFYIKTEYNQERIDIIRTLKSVWWNSKIKTWIAKATTENLEILQNAFSYWNDYAKVYDIIAWIDDPMILEVYRTPDNIKKVWIKIRGYKTNADFLNGVTGRYFDKGFNRWAIPNKRELIDKILEYYKSKGAKIINRLPEKSHNFYKNNTICHQTLQKQLIGKYNSKYAMLVAEISDVMIAQRYSWNTIKAYIPHIVNFSKYIGKNEIKNSEVDIVNRYISLVSKDKISESKINIVINALKFYYTKVVFRPDFEIEKIKRPRKQRTLPTILSVNEIERILKALNNLKHLAILFTLYSTGTRLNEILNLRVEDVYFDRNQIFIRKGKGGKDRVVMLSDSLKHLLILYTDEYKPVYWLFEGQDKMHQYSASSVRNVVKKAARKAGVRRTVTPHKFRHCFATHLIDNGTDIRYVQELLGHKDIKTTMIYTHVTTNNITKIKSPIDNLNLNV